MSADLPYVGTELEIFALASTWKRYWSSFVIPFLSGDVLEVGAGIGANVSFLCRDTVQRWVCLEPDLTLCQRLKTEVKRLRLSHRCHVIHGTLSDLSKRDCFDAILYLDVLEHITNDSAELRRSVTHLRPGGVLIILTPAHPWLYSEFDRAIGHERRYTKGTMIKTVPAGLNAQFLIYLDSVGLLASGANRLLLRRARPTSRQILFWDRVLVSCSLLTDRFLGYSFGKSLLGVWRKPVAS